MRHRRYESPVGEYLIVVDEDDAITGIYQTEGAHPDVGAEDPAAAQEAVDQLEEYFAGTRTEFDLNLRAHGSPFQQHVWDAIAEIPYGQTATYGEIAEAVGSAARAVGTATGRNPHSIVVPCHRVIGANRALTGYGGGIQRKVELLRLEGLVVDGEATARTRIR